MNTALHTDSTVLNPSFFPLGVLQWFAESESKSCLLLDLFTSASPASAACELFFASQFVLTAFIKH